MPRGLQSAKTGVAPASERDGQLHLVYAGNVSHRDSQGFNNFADLGRRLAAQSIHLHLFPAGGRISPNQVKLAKSSPFFHCHRPVPYPDLIPLLRRFDAGLWVHQRDDTDPVTHPRKYETAMGNKLFSHLEAGIPTIVNDDLLFGAQFVEEHNIGISIPYGEFDALGLHWQSVDVTLLRSNILEKRMGLLNWDFHAPRLQSFYDTLVG